MISLFSLYESFNKSKTSVSTSATFQTAILNIIIGLELPNRGIDNDQNNVSVGLQQADPSGCHRVYQDVLQQKHVCTVRTMS